MSDDDPQKALFARIKTSLSKFMKEPVLEGKTSTVYSDKKTTPPDDIRKHLGINPGDELKWYALPGNLALVRKSAAIAIIALMVYSSFSAPLSTITTPVFAQTANDSNNSDSTAMIAPGTNSTTTDTLITEPQLQQEILPSADPSVARFPVEKIGATHAWLPIRIEVIAPAGYQQSVIPESFNPDTKAQGTLEKNTPSEGLDTLRFTTNSIDTYKVTFGVKYLSHREDVFKVSVFTADEELFTKQMPFEGTEFVYELQFTSSYKPVIPTPEENLGAVYPLLEGIRNQGLGTEFALKNLSESIFWSADLSRTIAILLVIVIIIMVLTVKVLRNTVYELKELFFSSRDGGLEELDPEYRQQNTTGDPQQQKRSSNSFIQKFFRILRMGRRGRGGSV